MQNFLGNKQGLRTKERQVTRFRSDQSYPIRSHDEQRLEVRCRAPVRRVVVTINYDDRWSCCTSEQEIGCYGTSGLFMSYKCVAVAPNAPGMPDCTGPGPLVFAFFFISYNTTKNNRVWTFFWCNNCWVRLPASPLRYRGVCAVLSIFIVRRQVGLRVAPSPLPDRTREVTTDTSVVPSASPPSNPSHTSLLTLRFLMAAAHAAPCIC